MNAFVVGYLALGTLSLLVVLVLAHVGRGSVGQAKYNALGSDGQVLYHVLAGVLWPVVVIELTAKAALMIFRYIKRLLRSKP